MDAPVKITDAEKQMAQFVGAHLAELANATNDFHSDMTAEGMAAIQREFERSGAETLASDVAAASRRRARRR